MTKCYQRSFEFPRVNRRIVEARFDGGDITSDGGVLLLRQADRLTGLSDSIARALSDSRRQASCDHDVPGLVRQRLYAIALGYEDLNDHDGLRQDVALQTAVDVINGWPVHRPYAVLRTGLIGRLPGGCTKCCSISSSPRSSVHRKS